MSRPPLLSPVIVASVAAFAAVAGALIIWLAASTPWLGAQLIPLDNVVVSERSAFGLSEEAIVESIGLAGAPPIALIPLDLLAEPDGLLTYAELDAFYERQSRLHALLLAAELELNLRRGLA